MDKNFVESWVGTLGTLPRMTAFTVPESGLVDGLEQARRTLLASVLVFTCSQYDYAAIRCCGSTP